MATKPTAPLKKLPRCPRISGALVPPHPGPLPRGEREKEPRICLSLSSRGREKESRICLSLSSWEGEKEPGICLSLSLAGEGERIKNLSFPLPSRERARVRGKGHKHTVHARFFTVRSRSLTTALNDAVRKMRAWTQKIHRSRPVDGIYSQLFSLGAPRWRPNPNQRCNSSARRRRHRSPHRRNGDTRK